eukprot:1158743-Pelagomonas_calceolata.AAC.31
MQQLVLKGLPFTNDRVMHLGHKVVRSRLCAVAGRLVKESLPSTNDRVMPSTNLCPSTKDRCVPSTNGRVMRPRHRCIEAFEESPGDGP